MGVFVFISLIAVRILCGHPLLTALTRNVPRIACIACVASAVTWINHLARWALTERGERSEVRLSRAPLASECGADVGYLPASGGVWIGESWHSILQGSADDLAVLVVALRAQCLPLPFAVLLHRLVEL